MPIFSITNLITCRQLSHGNNYRSVKLCSRSIEKKVLTQTDPNQHGSKEKRGDVGKYLKTQGGKLSPKKISDNLQGNRICIWERQLLLHKCCLRSNHRPASWRHLKSEPDIHPLHPTPPARERREAHSSIGNLKKPGGKIWALHWLLLCREDSSLNSRLKGTLFSNA